MKFGSGRHYCAAFAAGAACAVACITLAADGTRLPQASAAIPAILSGSTSADDLLPDGEGRDIVEYVCSQCHDLLQVTQASKTPQQWRFTVTTMVSQGAPLAEHEVDTVIRYLSEHFGQ